MSRQYKVLQLQLVFNVTISDLPEQIVQSLPADRFEVTTAFLIGRPGPNDMVSKAPKSVYFDFRESDLKGLSRYKTFQHLAEHCRKEHYDVIIAHRFKPMSLLMMLNQRLVIPVCIGVQHGIGDYDRWTRRLEASILMKRNWKTVGVSRAVCEYLVGCRSGFNSQNTVQINNAIDIHRAESVQLPRDTARAELGLPIDKVILGAIGRLVPIKGHTLLIKALAMLKDDFPDVNVAIIGEGRSRQNLEEEILSSGLQGRVHLLGQRDNAIQYVKAFDVFVMPSLSEGLPLSLLEGMSARLPVVGSDIASLRPILEDCGGRVFSAGRVESLAGTLGELLRCSDLQRQNEGERAYEYLCKAHDIGDFRKQYRDLVEKMLVAGGVA